MYYVASVEQRSEHPIGKAISAYFKSQNGDIMEPQNFSLLAGQGVRTNVDGLDIIVGKADLLVNYGIVIPEDILTVSGTYISKGATTVFVGINQMTVGLVVLSDKIREDAPKSGSTLYYGYIKSGVGCFGS